MFNKKTFLIFTLFLAGFFFFNISSASATTLYYNNTTTDGDWNTLGNWWMNAGFTTPAGALPVATDDVIIHQNVDMNSGSDPSVNTMIVDGSAYFGISATVVNGSTFRDTSVNGGTITGNAAFELTATNGGFVTGLVTDLRYYNGGGNIDFGTLSGNWWDDSNFTIESYMFPTETTDVIISGSIGQNISGRNLDCNSITVNGPFNFGASVNIIVSSVATFNDTSRNVTNITGPVVFNDTSYNQGTITGPVVFNDTSYNQGTITGPVIFNNSSYITAGSINGNTTFNDISYYWSGSITGVVTFNYAHAGVITIADGGKWGRGTGSFVGDDGLPFNSWVFNGSSVNNGTINGSVIFNNNSYNYGTIIGDVTFNNSSYNNTDKTITGNVIFNDISSNRGIINGIAKYNYATGGVITIATGGNWGPGTATSNVGIDDVPITSWVFNGSSTNGGTFTGNATFNNTGFNVGTITGDVIFNDATYNRSGVINGDVTFNGTSFNGGTINGNATFNNASGGIITLNTGQYWSSVSGTIKGSDNLDITSWVFNGTGYNIGNFTGSAIFNDTSYNSSSRTITGSVTFNTSSHNRGTISGPATFNNASYNRGTVTENAIFYNTSTNGTDSFTATVSGNAKFFDTSVNHRTVTGNACFAPTASIHGGTVGGNATICGVVPVSAIPSASLITLTSSTLNGEITDMGEEDATSRGFEYGLTDIYGTTVTQSSGPYSTGVFTTDLIGLTCGTTYHYRTFATNTAGTGVSADASFATSGCPSSGSSSGSMSTKTKALKNTIIPPTIPKTTPPALTYNFGTTTLRKGSSGEAVKELQRFLNTKLNLGLIVDGKLGPKTIAVIKKWQLDNGLVPDGLVGPKTKAKMNTN